MIIARSGRDALKVAAQALPEVGIIDIGMPEMDGFEVARADLVPDGAKRWTEWYELCVERGVRPPALTRPEAAMLRADAGATLGMVRAVACV